MNNRYICKGKRKDNGEWIEGYLVKYSEHYYIYYEYADEMYQTGNYLSYKDVIPETVRQCIGLKDKNGKWIFEGDIVKIVNFQVGIVTQECAAFGVSIAPGIDWDYLDSEIAEITGCDNMPHFCRNDNFISLYELMWNYNQEEFCGVVEIIGNIHDNPELLEVER